MTSQKRDIISLWFIWQFYEMPSFLFQVWKNYLMFATNYFSVPLLLKTFFSPWRRYNWRYPKGFDLQEFFNTLVSNTFSRFLGALMRTVLIIIGIFLQIFVFVAGIIVLALWMLMPILILMGFIFAFTF